MKEDNKLVSERLLELESGLAIWKIGIDKLREQDKNARVMEGDLFKILENTIKKDKRLESLPLVAFKDDGRNEFQIVSGHPRIRAARMAGLEYVYCLVDESNLSEDLIKSKQLAHNAIQGHDDDQILLEIYNSIDDIEARAYTGLSEKSIMKDINSIELDEVGVEYETEVVSLLFTEKGAKDFEQTLERVQNSEKILMAEKTLFDEFVKSAREIAMNDDIRNVTAIVLRMCQIVNEYYENSDKPNGKDQKEK